MMWKRIKFYTIFEDKWSSRFKITYLLPAVCFIKDTQYDKDYPAIDEIPALKGHVEYSLFVEFWNVHFAVFMEIENK